MERQWPQLKRKPIPYKWLAYVNKKNINESIDHRIPQLWWHLSSIRVGTEMPANTNVTSRNLTLLPIVTYLAKKQALDTTVAEVMQMAKVPKHEVTILTGGKHNKDKKINKTGGTIKCKISNPILGEAGPWAQRNTTFLPSQPGRCCRTWSHDAIAHPHPMARLSGQLVPFKEVGGRPCGECNDRLPCTR